MDSVKVSKYISMLLRHKPWIGGLTLDANGWCDTPSLIEALRRRFGAFEMSDLENIVATNNKKRYSFNEDKSKIRANQGHSVHVDVNLTEATPPEALYHGTSDKVQAAIEEEGLLKRNRLHVHLSPDIDTALIVGKRHGVPIVYQVDSGQMSKDGYKFYLSENGVWLTDHVPPEYLRQIR